MEASSSWSDDMEAAAAAWIAKRDHGMTEADQVSFRAWLDADKRHPLVFAHLESTWSALPALGRLPRGRIQALMAARRSRRVFPAIWVSGLAAAIAVGLWVFLRPLPAISLENGAIPYQADARGEVRFTLPDGSIAELRRGTELLFKENPPERRIKLLRGEAHFTVAKRTGDTFSVVAADVSVRDLGTAFDIRLEPDRVAVLVTEGRVTVVARPDTRKANQLSAGEEAVVRITAPTPSVEVLRPTVAETENILSWKNLRLVFSRTPLSAVVAEMNRRLSGQLAVGDAETARVLVSGSFQPDSVETFMRLLDAGFGITSEMGADGKIILRKTK